MIRIGLMLDDTREYRWKREVIEAIRRTGCAEIALIVINQAAGTGSGLGSKLSHGAFHAYRIVDRMLFPVADNPFEEVDLRETFGNAKELKVVPQMKKFSDRFEDKDVAAIKAENLDILIRFGFRVLRGPILDAAKYGVWSFHHGDAKTHRGAPACFWEVADDHPTTGALVQILSEELDGGKVLDRIWCSANRYSYGRTQAELYWNCIQMMPRLIQKLDRGGITAVLSNGENGKNGVPHIYDRRLYKTPGNVEGAMAAGRILGRIGGKAVRRAVSKEQWRLLYAIEDDLGKTPLYRYRELTPPKDRFWADPFVVERDGQFHIFFEDYVYATDRGHISVITLDAKGNVVKEATPVVKEDYHLSYPYTFTANGKTYMVPESSACRGVWLYECTEFPLKWEKKRALMENVLAVDPTIFFHNDRWWMFMNIAETEKVSKYTYLHLFHTDDPINGKWTPHAQNPIVSDARCARPAGKPFVSGGHLYRPSQDCAGSYGQYIRLNRVIQLDPEHYEEKEESCIGPHLTRKQLGIHTLNRDGKLTIVDALFRVSKLG